jgi:hypothetical protein
MELCSSKKQACVANLSVLIRLNGVCVSTANGKVTDSFTSIHEAPLHWSGRGHGRDGSHETGLPPENVLQEIDAQELNRMFVRRYGNELHISSCSQLTMQTLRAVQL